MNQAVLPLDNAPRKRHHLSAEGHTELTRALATWKNAGNRVWDDETMCAILGKLVTHKFTKTHMRTARLRLELRVATGTPSSADIATRERALGNAPAAPPAPAAPAPDQVPALLAAISDKLDRILDALAR